MQSGLVGGLRVSQEFEEFSKLMMEEMKKAYSKKAFDHVMHPRNVGSFEDATGYGEVSEPGSDRVGVWIQVKKGVITRTGFFVKGCTTLIAVGSALTEVIKGKTVEKVQEVTPEGLIKYLGGLPPKTEHCAEMAVSALREAVMSHYVNELTKGARKNKKFRHIRLEL